MVSRYCVAKEAINVDAPVPAVMLRVPAVLPSSHCVKEYRADCVALLCAAADTVWVLPGCHVKVAGVRYVVASTTIRRPCGCESIVVAGAVVNIALNCVKGFRTSLTGSGVE